MTLLTRAFQLHAFLQIHDFLHIVAELRRDKLVARITPWPEQFLADVGQCEPSGIRLERPEIRRVHALGIPDQFLQRNTQRRSNPFDDRIRLRMDGRPIQRIVPVLDSKETRRLLEGLVAETFNLLQFRPGAKPARLLPSRQ